MTHTLPRRIVSEFFGTGFLVAAVVGSGIMGERLASGNVAIALLANTIATGAALGMGRIAGDTAVVLLLGGGTLQLEANGGIPGLNILQGTGSTLTTYVYANSPSGEGGASQKAYAAAFLLLLLVLVLNWAVDRIARGSERLGWIR